MNKSSESLDEVVELAWSRVVEALDEGQITLKSGKVLQLEADQIVDLAQKMAAVKIKKPQIIPTPEDYILKPTSEDSDD